MIIKFDYIIFVGLLCSLCVSSTQRYWDLGVVIDKNENIIIQKDVDLSKVGSPEDAQTNSEQIMAFRANNFIAPILHNLKYPILNPRSHISPKDEFIFSLTTKDAVNFIKRSFLNDQFGRFFSLYGQIKINEVSKIENINTLYIQNLYRSNQYSAAKNILDKQPPGQLTDEMLLYLIKTNIKLKHFKIANNQIELFKKKHPNSDLLRYINNEQQLLNNKNEK